MNEMGADWEVTWRMMVICSFLVTLSSSQWWEQLALGAQGDRWKSVLSEDDLQNTGSSSPGVEAVITHWFCSGESFLCWKQEGKCFQIRQRMWACLCNVVKNRTGDLGETLAYFLRVCSKWREAGVARRAACLSFLEKLLVLCYTQSAVAVVGVSSCSRRTCSSFSPSQVIKHDAKCWQQIRIHDEEETSLSILKRRTLLFWSSHN